MRKDTKATERTMNPDPGDWNDADWARERALRAVCDQLTPGHLSMLLGAARSIGQQEGAADARSEMRKALGFSESQDG